MNIVELVIVNWVKSGLIAWLVWYVAALGYMLWSFRLDMDLYHHLTESIDDDTAFRNQPTKGKAIIITRTIIWPWGLLDRTRAIIDVVDKALTWKQNRYRRN